MLDLNQVAPNSELPKLDGSSAQLYPKNGKLSLITFYKFSCPTCQLTLPYIQKIYDAYGDVVNIAVVAQDGPEKTSEFARQYNITMPILLDQDPYPVSRQHGLVSVPTIFLVNPDGTIRYAGEGFVKQELLNLSDVLAEKSSKPQIDLFGNDNVPEIKPG
jgi:peroxiredoxin